MAKTDRTVGWYNFLRVFFWVVMGIQAASGFRLLVFVGWYLFLMLWVDTFGGPGWRWIGKILFVMFSRTLFSHILSKDWGSYCPFQSKVGRLLEKTKNMKAKLIIFVSKIFVWIPQLWLKCIKNIIKKFSLKYIQ